MSYPHPPQPQWGPPVPPALPSRATTVAAAALALLAGVLAGADLGNFLVQASDFLGAAFRTPLFVVSFALQALAVIMLLIGSIMLFARVGAGRFLVPAGTLCLLGLIGWGVANAGPAVLTVSMLVTPAFGLVASVLALVPSTGQWIAAKRQPPHGFPPPPPGYQQPGYGPPRQW